MSEKLRKGQKSNGVKCKTCGSTTHLHSSHKNCPFNKVKDNAAQHGGYTESLHSDVSMSVLFDAKIH